MKMLHLLLVQLVLLVLVRFGILVRQILVQTSKVFPIDTDPVGIALFESARDNVLDRVRFPDVPQIDRFEGYRTLGLILIHLERKLTGNWFMVAYIVTWMALVRRLLHGKMHVAIVVFVYRVQYTIRPGGSSFHVVFIATVLELECWRKLWQALLQLLECASFAPH
uniref:Putative secreted peptide n=1 Tax=Anopheles braziliensis TaxID=58242 RepID=A0A2M3ZR75_9DIPT